MNRTVFLPLPSGHVTNSEELSPRSTALTTVFLIADTTWRNAGLMGMLDRPMLDCLMRLSTLAGGHQGVGLDPLGAHSVTARLRLPVSFCKVMLSASRGLHLDAWCCQMWRAMNLAQFISRGRFVPQPAQCIEMFHQRSHPLHRLACCQC